MQVLILGWNREMWIKAAKFWADGHGGSLPDPTLDAAFDIQSYWERLHAPPSSPEEMWAKLMILQAIKEMPCA